MAKSNDWEGGGGSPEFIGITLSARLDLKGGPWIPNEGARPPLHPITQFPPTSLPQSEWSTWAPYKLCSFVPTLICLKVEETRMCTNCNSCSTNLNKHKSSLTQADTEWRTLWRAPVSCMLNWLRWTEKVEIAFDNFQLSNSAQKWKKLENQVG